MHVCPEGDAISLLHIKLVPTLDISSTDILLVEYADTSGHCQKEKYPRSRELEACHSLRSIDRSAASQPVVAGRAPVALPAALAEAADSADKESAMPRSKRLRGAYTRGDEVASTCGRLAPCLLACVNLMIVQIFSSFFFALFRFISAWYRSDRSVCMGALFCPVAGVVVL